MKSAKRERPRTSSRRQRGSDELTLAEAARLLHVSRLYLITLVEEGRFPSVRVTRGGHRRISRAEVLAYKEKLRKSQMSGLEKMVDASQRMRLYDDEIRELRFRRRQR